LLLPIHARSVNHAIESRRNSPVSSQETKEVSQSGDGLLKAHSAHPLTQVLNEPFQIGGRKRREPLGVVRELQPCKKLSGNMALPADRAGNASTNFSQMSHEGNYVNMRRIRGKWVWWSVNVPALLKEAREYKNTAGFLMKPLAKPAMAFIKMLVAKVLDPANSPLSEIVGNKYR